MRLSIPVFLGSWTLFVFTAGAIAQNAKPPGDAKPEAGKTPLKFLLHLPPGYDKDKTKQWPLVLFLHGSGERGDDVEKVKIHGPPKLAAAGKDLGCVVVSPQCPAGQRWDTSSLNVLLDEVMKTHRIDADRVYLTGLSMGGAGTWTLATASPERFAAIAPVCGFGDPSKVGVLKNMPTWVFHGDADKAVPISASERMVEALKKAGNEKVQFTVYPGVGHDSWTQTYNDPKFWEWLLAQKRAGEAKGK